MAPSKRTLIVSLACIIKIINLTNPSHSGRPHTHICAHINNIYLVDPKSTPLTKVKPLWLRSRTFDRGQSLWPKSHRVSGWYNINPLGRFPLNFSEFLDLTTWAGPHFCSSGFLGISTTRVQCPFLFSSPDSWNQTTWVRVPFLFFWISWNLIHLGPVPHSWNPPSQF